MDITEFQIKNPTKIVSVSFRMNTISRIKSFLKDNKIKKFSPIVDKIVNDWLDQEEKEK